MAGTPKPLLKIIPEDELEDKVCVVVGTRPGIIMFSPIVRALERANVRFFILHTGQHYSYNLDGKLFEELELPKPDHLLDSVRHTALHGAQTAEMLRGCEDVLLSERPKLVLVGGDANTNLAGALAARKLHIRVAHVEAGERSYDWRMPEEHNRVLIDHMSEYLFATSVKGEENLKADNVRGQVFMTGNPIVDACCENVEIAARRSSILEELGIEPGGYAVATVHREESTDYPDSLAGALEGMSLLSQELDLPVVFAAHPRTLKRISEFGFGEAAEAIRTIPAVGYLDFINLLSHARLALTDSGGVQQEACILGVPCVTLRETTEWTETLQLGANILAGTDPGRILAGGRKMISAGRDWLNPFGDGRAAERIVVTVGEILDGVDHWTVEADEAKVVVG
jgi:UDP-N-acetylglucosamine 2-epimerase (non-hydrolysing)